MLKKIFALSYLQVDLPIKIPDIDKLNNNYIYIWLVTRFAKNPPIYK